MLSKKMRLWLALIGLVLIICSLVILASNLQTTGHVRARQTIVPTLLTPPAEQP